MGQELGRTLGFMRQLVRMAALATALGVGSVSVAFAQSASLAALDPAVVTLIGDNYRACVAIELAHVDTNANGKLDSTEDAEFFSDGAAFCQEELQAEMAHAARMAQFDTHIAAANAQVRATTAEIINGAKRQIGLEP